MVVRVALMLGACALTGCATAGPASIDNDPVRVASRAREMEQQEAERARSRELAQKDAEARQEREDYEQRVKQAPVEEHAPVVTAQAEAQADLDALRAEAKKHGYKELFSSERGLTGVLEDVVENAIDVRKLRDFAFEVTDFVDPGFVAAQVLGKRVRFTSEYTDNQVILQRYKGAVYENTSLYALEFAAVKVVGVETYRTVIGGTAQAFIIEPAW